MTYKLYRTFDFLFEKLIKENMSQTDLAKLLGVSLQSVCSWVQKFNFDVNFHSRSNLGKHIISVANREKINISIRNNPNRSLCCIKMREIRKCVICNNEFSIIKDSLNPRWSKKITCSKGCSYVLRDKQHISCKISFDCLWCGKLTEAWSNKAKFCSYTCSHQYRTGKTYEELFGEEAAILIKEKLAVAREKQRWNTYTVPVKLIYDVLIELVGEPKIEYRIKWYNVDLCYPEVLIAIEVDGNYWHKYPDGTAEDRYKTKVLEGFGWKVFRFWESDIKNDAKQCAMIIKECYDKNIK